MLERYRHPFTGKEWNFKTIVATMLFGAICLVMALFGIANPGRMSSVSGGEAAIVNDVVISVSDFRQRQQIMERNSKLPLDKLPADQREMYTKELGRRTLEQMIMLELVYQNAYKQGIWAPNAQIRDELMGIPVFQDNGRFNRSHYENYLAQTGQSADNFEHQIRKEIVIHRLQGLFATAGLPSSWELDQLVALNSDTVNFRYVELEPSKLENEKVISDSEAKAYAQDPAHQEDIKQYYNQHALDYSLNERVHARHILLLVDDKHPDKEVLEKAKALKAKLTTSNFAKIAEKESQDPGSAKRGGDLGFFEKGRMVPQFEKAAFSLKPGQISDPIKTDYGYHLIYVEAHEQARKVGLDEAKAGIAKKLLARAKAPQLMENLKKAASSGKSIEVDGVLKKAGLSWQKADNVILAAPQVPGLTDPQDILMAVAQHKDKTGLIPGLVGPANHAYIVDVVGWKPNPKKQNKDEIEKTLAYAGSSDSFEDWIKSAENKASITRNDKLFER